MGSRGRFAAREFGMMRVVASGAGLISDRAEVGTPVPAGAAVCASFPIAISGAVAATAERWAVSDF